MARTKGTAVIYRPRRTGSGIREMNQFEKQMRKYYPKKSRFFYYGSHYQPSRGDNFKNPNNLAPQRYKRDFFRSFCADLARGAPEPSKIPQNLRCLKILAGSEIVWRKLIKQNKRLKHLVFESDSSKINGNIIKYLKYSKNLRSVTFKYKLPYFSERDCQKMLNTWGKTLETFKSFGFVSSRYDDDSEAFKRAMQTILKFPKLKVFQLKNEIDGKYFPLEKLQERNIAYNVPFYITDFNSLVKKFPESKPAGNVIIPIGSSSGKSEKMSLETCKFQKKSNQILSLNFGNVRYADIPLLPVFQNISSLDLIIPGFRCKSLGSSLGQLDNLVHLSVEICGGGEEKNFRSFFSYLNKNVALHKKLETFLMKTDFQKEKEDEEEENGQNSDAIVHFFEACSKSVKTVHFDFRYRDKISEDPEPFYQGLSKLECIKSLSLFLRFAGLKSKEQINKLCKVISEMKSLKELDFKLLARDSQEKQVNIKLPPQLKKLSIGMDTSHAPFDTSKTLWPLTNLVHLELEFADFSSPKWGKILGDIIDKIKVLEVLVLKKTQEFENEDGNSSQMKEKLDELMKEALNLKLIVFANMESSKIIVFRRKRYPWSEINPIIDNLSFQNSEIKSYA